MDTGDGELRLITFGCDDFVWLGEGGRLDRYKLLHVLFEQSMSRLGPKAKGGGNGTLRCHKKGVHN